MKGSRGRVLVYGGARGSTRDTLAERFIDSNFVGYLNIRKYLIGFVFTAYDTIICWKVNLHKALTSSIIEKEFIVMKKNSE